MYKLTTKTDDLKALLACRSTAADREALQTIHITIEYIEATDGKILLRISRGNLISTDAPAGVYKVIALNKISIGLSEIVIDAVDMQYPNTDNVIPKNYNNAYTPDLNIMPVTKKNPQHSSAWVIYLYANTGNAYSAHLIERLAPIGGKWNVLKCNKDAPVRLDYHLTDDQKYIAVIMPFNM